MAIIVEDGSGRADAQSLTSVDFADQYLLNYGQPEDWFLLTRIEREAFLCNASEYINLTYYQLWKGQKKTQDQAFWFPAYGVYGRDGWLYDSNSVPLNLQKAVAEMAWRERATDLFSDVSEPAVTERSVAVGSIKEAVKYASPDTEKDIYVKVERLLADLIDGSGLYGPDAARA